MESDGNADVLFEVCIGDRVEKGPINTDVFKFLAVLGELERFTDPVRDILGVPFSIVLVVGGNL